MKDLLSVCFVILTFSTSAKSSEYRGHVGNLEAVFSLEWNEDGTVTGTYSYPARPGTTYQLSGVNPREGYLVLDEYTGSNRSARCELSKTLTETHIVWAGKMINADGRVFEMSFHRLRSAPPEPAVMVEELPLVDFGNPQIPEDLEERLAEAGRRAESLIEGDGLDAHIFGELHYGWVAPGHLSYGGSPDAEIRRWNREGVLVWAALRIAGDRAEVQFETTDGNRIVLSGTRAADDRLLLRGGGQSWELKRLNRGDALVWTGSTTSGPERSLLLYRPRDAIYYGAWEPMEDIAPEAWLWLDHSWGSRFHAKRFPFTQGNEVEARVSRIVEEDGQVIRVECESETGITYAADFESARERERIPAALGMPVYLMVEGTRIRRLLGEWHVISWRGRPGVPPEFLMFPFEMAEIDWTSPDPVEINPALYGDLPKRILRPDFFGLIDWPGWVHWYVEEDVIAWPLPGDEGAAMLELEGIGLDESDEVLPWNPATTPIPFPTGGNRVGQYNITTGYGQTLPGNR